VSDVDQGPSDEELFTETVSDETPDAPVVTEEAEQQPEKPARDEAGRFAKKEEAEVVAEAPAEKPAVDDNAAHVPSWRARELREERDAIAAKLAALETERSQWQRQQQERRAEQPTPAKAQDEPDPLLNPKEYREFIQKQVREDLLNDRREESLQRAAEAHPDEFKEAYAAAQRAVDPALKARMQATRDPGKTLLEWHRENKVKAEVGTDPNAWLEKKLEERLNDPAFLQKAIERSKGVSQQPDGRPRINIPPSLNGASRSNASLKSANEDMSDEELFRELAG
jgi:hypothetical protein